MLTVVLLQLQHCQGTSISDNKGIQTSEIFSSTQGQIVEIGRLCLAQPAMQGDPIGCCAQGKAAGSSTDDMLNAALGPNSSSNSMVGHARYSYHAAYVSTVVIGACILAFTVGILIWRLFQHRSVGGGRGEAFLLDRFD